jgi:hypothetical protein
LDGAVVLVPVAPAALLPFCFKELVARLPAAVVVARLLVLLCLAAAAALLVVGAVVPPVAPATVLSVLLGFGGIAIN